MKYRKLPCGEDYNDPAHPLYRVIGPAGTSFMRYMLAKRPGTGIAALPAMRMLRLVKYQSVPTDGAR